LQAVALKKKNAIRGGEASDEPRCQRREYAMVKEGEKVSNPGDERGFASGKEKSGKK